MTQEPIAKQILPMQLDSGDMEAESAGEYLYEPNGQEILADLLPRSLRSQLLQSFLDTEAGEQAARMQAMDNATNNAGEMIDKLSLVYNRLVKQRLQQNLQRLSQVLKHSNFNTQHFTFTLKITIL